MKIINEKEYYKMAELVEFSKIGNHTIAFYNKKGLLPQGINTSKNMKYYPKITLTVLNLIKYLKENLNFSIDYIKELFDYYKIDFEDNELLIIQAIEMVSFEITNPTKKSSLDNQVLKEVIALNILEDKTIYFKTEVEVYNVYKELRDYDISSNLIKEYITTAKKLAIMEKELSDKVFEQLGYVPEVLVLDILNKLKPFIFNKFTLKTHKEEIY